MKIIASSLLLGTAAVLIFSLPAHADYNSVDCNGAAMQYFTCQNRVDQTCYQYPKSVLRAPGPTTPASYCTTANTDFLSCSDGQGSDPACAITSATKPLGCCIFAPITGGQSSCVDATNLAQATACINKDLGPFSTVVSIATGVNVSWKPNQECAAFTECAVAPPAASTAGQGTTNPLQDLLIKSPGISIKIPGLDFSTINKPDEEGYLYIPWLAEYMTAMYKFLIGIVSIVAMVMIVIQGTRIVASGGGEAKMDAYKKIFRAIVGLLIAWGSYAILYTVNPSLVQFNALKVKYIETQYIPDYKSNPDDAPNEGDSGSSKTLNVGELAQYKGQGCGKNLAEIAAVYQKQQICQGVNHCANFVSRVLIDSGCPSSIKSNGAGTLAKNLVAAGWKMVPNKNGMQKGDIAVWGDPNTLSGGHIAVLTGNGVQVIDSGWDMSWCWGDKKASIQSACGPNYPIGYSGKETGRWVGQYQTGIEPSDSSALKAWKVRENYARCVVQNGGCATVRGSDTASCNYCAKLGPITEFDNSGGNTRQCIDYSNGGKWDYYIKNPTNP